MRGNKARILDATGRPVAEAAGNRRTTQLALRIPQSVAAAVESGDWSAFRLEVLVGEVWRGAMLVDRGEPVRDEHDRVREAQATRPASIRIVS